MALPGPIPEERHDWQTIKTLLPYLWAWKGRVVFALSCLLLAKLTTVGGAAGVQGHHRHLHAARHRKRMEQAVLLVPLGLLAAYGALRFATVLFTELREIFFARVTQRAVRTITLQVFEHLHSLSAALPPRPPDRRPDARHRARHALDRFADQLHAVFDPADPGRDSLVLGILASATTRISR